MAATDHQVDSAICGAFTLLWGEKTAQNFSAFRGHTANQV